MIAPFPFHALPHVASGETRAVRMLRRAYGGLREDTLAFEVSETLGHPVTIAVQQRAWVKASSTSVGARGPVTLLTHARLGQAKGPMVAIEVEAELALAAVTALSGGRHLPKIALGRKVDPLVSGALAGILQHLGRAFSEGDLTIERIDASAAEVQQAFGSNEVMLFDAAVQLGALRSRARVMASIPALIAHQAPFGAGDAGATLTALGSTPCTLHLVIAAGYASLQQVVPLERGDVIVIDPATTERQRDAFHYVRALAASNASRGVEVTAEHGLARGPFRLGKERVNLAAEPSPIENRPMRDSRDPRAPTDDGGATTELARFTPREGSSAIAEVIAEMPVLVRVEVGSVTLPARDWASLGVGDVVVLDTAVGDAVVLRIAGKEMGRGELVDVDGNLGVRLTERLR
ncbi:MAG: hypothetical protein NVSMB1_22250 [Polyangiales bacterium]